MTPILKACWPRPGAPPASWSRAAAWATRWTCPPTPWLPCPDAGESVALYTSLVVREDAQQLFGFATFEERQVFEVLLTISKVGARTALAILSLYRPDDLRRIVLEEDVDALTRVSGIGKKTAQHVFLELKYKLKVEDVPQAAVLAANGRPGSVFRTCLMVWPILAILRTNALLWSRTSCCRSPTLTSPAPCGRRSRRWRAVVCRPPPSFSYVPRAASGPHGGGSF